MSDKQNQHNLGENMKISRNTEWKIVPLIVYYLSRPLQKHITKLDMTHL